MGLFKFFTANSFVHIFAFIPRAHRKRFLPFILRSVHSFTVAFDSWVTS